MRMNAPEKIMRQLLCSRFLEVNSHTTRRIQASENVADYAVFAGGIEPLQHNQKRMLVLRVHQKLEFVHFLPVLLNFCQSRFAWLMLAVVAGIEILQPDVGARLHGKFFRIVGHNCFSLNLPDSLLHTGDGNSQGLEEPPLPRVSWIRPCLTLA